MSAPDSPATTSFIDEDRGPCEEHLGEIARIHARLEAATHAGKVGIWEINSDKSLVLNEMAKQILHVGSGEEPDLDWFFSRVDQEDRVAIEESLATTGELDREIRFRLPSGQVRWLQIAHAPASGENRNWICSAGTLIDTTSRREERDKYERALEIAEAAAHAKSDFLARMSHEIRTPMNAILAPAQLLSETGLSESQRELVTMIQRAGEHLLDVINTILDFSKLEAGKMPLYEETFQMESVLEEVVAPFSIVADNKEISLVSCVEPGASGYWVGDVSRIRQVLLNLVSNAVKFTMCGNVEVIVLPWEGEGEIGSGLKIRVIDTGQGLSLQETERIFMPFEQSPVGNTRRPGGTGLGLAICRELVDLMGGILGVESTPGEGSEFWFCIPLQRGTAEFLTPPTAGGFAEEPVWDSPPNVLVVEDNAANRKVVSLLLKKLGCQVSNSADGRQAMDALSTMDFDLVFMDCEMPVLDGYDCSKEIRRREEGSGIHLPIVALSAHVGDDHIRLCKLSGMDDILAKPVVIEDLKKCLLRWYQPGKSH